MAVDNPVTDPFLASVLETSRAARAQALALIEAIEQQKRDNPEMSIQISRQHKLLTANLAQLRGLHRAACFAAKDTKAVTAEARQEVDKLHLQLQNLYYEQRHLQGEIEACESFKYVQFPDMVMSPLLTTSVSTY